MRHDGSRPNESAFANGHAGKNDNAATNGCAVPYSRGNHVPVGLSLQVSVCSGAWIKIVDEQNAMSDEDVIFDCDSLANETVRGDLAPAPDTGILLNLDEGPDPGIVAHSAAVQIDEIRLKDLHSVAQYYVGGNWHEQ